MIAILFYTFYRISLAVFQFWKVTVRNVITETTTKATAYTHQYIGIL